MSKVVLIYSTIDSQSTGEKLCEQLLQEKLIACANIFPQGISLYQWKGQMEHSQEHTIILKTLADKVERLQSRFVSMHPYDCPCFVEITTDRVLPEFSQWVETELS